MTTPHASATAEPSLGHEMLYAARYYLGSPLGLLALGGLAIAVGLYFGGWGWLVAAGLAPIVLSTLPCLVMCVFGVCTMCKSRKTQSEESDAVADPMTLPITLVDTKAGQLTVNRSSYCDSTIRPKASP
ncbi:MAG: hypothetical protein GC182_05325 [Rhodopseudomonas sp.]|nr:hypothetical protein [Rhodopseudomonas sp.]